MGNNQSRPPGDTHPAKPEVLGLIETLTGAQLRYALNGDTKDVDKVYEFTIIGEASIEETSQDPHQGRWTYVLPQMLTVRYGAESILYALRLRVVFGRKR